MSVGVKAGYEGEAVESQELRRQLWDERVESGEYRPANGYPLDPEKAGFGEYLDRRLGERAVYELGFLPPMSRRGDGEWRLIPLPGLSSHVEPDTDLAVGVELEKFMVDPDMNPLVVRGYDEETGKNFPLYEGASDKAEMTGDLDESDFGPYPMENAADRYIADVAATEKILYDQEAMILPYGLSPQEVTPYRDEKHPYVAGIVDEEPNDSYRKFFRIAGMQLHRAIRRHCETREEALEFGAYVANRMAAYSWFFILITGASPNLEGPELVDKYMEADDERLSKKHKEWVQAALYMNGRPGHSLRTLGRYAGSESGGIHQKPLPEYSKGMLDLTQKMLQAETITTVGRVTGEHPDYRLRYDIGEKKEGVAGVGTGTIESSVLDPVYRKERFELAIHAYDGLIDLFYDQWKDTKSKGVVKQSGISREFSGASLLNGVNDWDMDRHIDNSVRVALHGPTAELRKIKSLNITAPNAAEDIGKVLHERGSLTDGDMRELRLAVLTSVPRSEWITDDNGVPSAASYFEGRVPSLSMVADERYMAQSELPEHVIREGILQDATRSLHNYLESIREQKRLERLVS